MKKFLMSFMVFAVFILPSNLCAAKNYVPVYIGSWNKFINDLKSKQIKFNEILDIMATFGDEFHKCMISCNSPNPNEYVYSIEIWQFVPYPHIPEDETFFKVFWETLRTFGLNKKETQEFGKKFSMDLLKSVKSKKFKENYIVYCTSRKIFFNVHVEAGVQGNIYILDDYGSYCSMKIDSYTDKKF